jgi:hypothetical protein
VTLTVFTGGASRLVLPVRPRRPEDEALAPFDPPEQAPPLEVVRLTEPGSGGRRMTWDVDTDTVDYEFRWVDAGRDLQEPWGIVTEDHVTYRYRITEGDPLSARSRLVADSDLVRGDELDVRVHTDCELSSDATTFFVTNAQRVTDHGEVVWEKTWETRIPRDLG